MVEQAQPRTGRSKNAESFAYIARFLLLLVALYVVLSIPAVDARVIVPFTAGIAKASGATLRLIGQEIIATGTVLAGETGCAVSIRNGCNGVEAMMFLVAAIVAFPAPWRGKLLGAAGGIVLIQLLNLIRVVTLFLLQCHKREFFSTFHVAIWPALIGGATIGFFYMWINWPPVAKHAANRR